MIYIGNVVISDFPVLLAPMEDISDPSFRKICKQMGADVVYTEFISSEGLTRRVAKSYKKLGFEEKERPVGIQIFGSNEESLIIAARIAEEAKADIIDINWGCPVKKIASKGGGAGILDDIPKMIKLTKAVVDAVKTPVTVKTRIGINSKNIVISEIAKQLQDIGIKALTVHGRSREQMYKGKADWDVIGSIKYKANLQIPLFGNGDIVDALQAKTIKEKYNVDGIMIGRGAIGNPWLFREIKALLNENNMIAKPTLFERIEVCRRHLHEAIAWKGEYRAIHEMRVHYSNYFKGIPNFKQYRIKLITAKTKIEVESVLNEISHLFSIC